MFLFTNKDTLETKLTENAAFKYQFISCNNTQLIFATIPIINI